MRLKKKFQGTILPKKKYQSRNKSEGNRKGDSRTQGKKEITAPYG